MDKSIDFSVTDWSNFVSRGNDVLQLETLDGSNEKRGRFSDWEQHLRALVSTNLLQRCVMRKSVCDWRKHFAWWNSESDISCSTSCTWIFAGWKCWRLFEACAPMVLITSSLLILALMAMRDMEIHQINVVTAFSNGRLEEKNTWRSRVNSKTKAGPSSMAR